MATKKKAAAKPAATPTDKPVKVLTDQEIAKKAAKAAKERARKAAIKAAATITPPYAGEVGAQSEVSTLHLHKDANNFGATHDESEARKLQKRAENGYTGQ